MSRRQQGHSDPEEAARVFTTLAGMLPDEVLVDCLPDLQPEAARRYLEEAARLATSRRSLPEKKQEPAAGHPVAAQSNNTLVLFTDGAARGNPGEAGAGFSINDRQGKEVYGGGAYLGHCTNNVAEYRALLLGLDKAKQLGCQHLFVNLDSELIVRQLQGVYKVKHENLKPLFADAKKKMSAFRSVEVKHVPRDRNRRADQLANRAIDEKEQFGAGA